MTNDDLSESGAEILANPQSWFFYNDSNDTIMTPNQFAGSGGSNEIAAFAGSVDGAAKMVLHDGTARYNIATAQFGGTALSAITGLSYRVYDESEATSQTPFLNFNVSFDGSTSYQNRLTMDPTAAGNAGVAGDTWTDVDALGAAQWYWTGGSGLVQWPAGANAGFDTTVKYQSWDDIVAAYDDIEMLSGGAFLGVRVGHPGPAAEESYVDSVEVNGTTYQFNN